MAFMDAIEERINAMVDRLQAICASYGLANQAAEELIIMNIFLYKFLNDRFIAVFNRFAADRGEIKDQIFKNDGRMMNAFSDAYPGVLALEYEDTIDDLSKHLLEDDFADRVQKTLNRISDYARQKGWSVISAGGKEDTLFDDIVSVIQMDQRNAFMRQIFGGISTEMFDFSMMDEVGYAFDYYSSIFERMVGKYSSDSGVYAEYYTPLSISKMISRCLVGMASVTENVEIYDPASGTGTLVLQLANELHEKDMMVAEIYAQDISVKAARLLRLNLVLHGMMDGKCHIAQADTLLHPAFCERENETFSQLKRFDYIVANPPFKMDFSTERDQIETRWNGTDRFFAGISKVPLKKKNGMASYTLFLQHVIYSLKADGKAAVVVPAGFLTAKMNIEKKIRQRLVDQRLLRGVILLPPQLFSNTGTNVAIIFIDKAHENKDIVLIDASSLGEVIKVSGRRKRTLSDQDIEMIVSAFIHKKDMNDFSTIVPSKEIAENNYILSAGRYFYQNDQGIQMDQNTFFGLMDSHQRRLNQLYEEGHQLEDAIKKMLEDLKNE